MGEARAGCCLLAAAILATLVYFFGFVKLFTGGHLSTAVWAWQAWTPETNYEHAKFIPLIVAFLIWHSRDKLKAAPVGSSLVGLVLYRTRVVPVSRRRAYLCKRDWLCPRCRFSSSASFFIYGAPKIARLLLFPIAFLFFMVPLNFLTQATARLQFLETGVASAICNFVGIAVTTVGTTVAATNGTFHFEVDEGCSGIRSLMAIAMLSAIYGHLTQDRLWKKLLIFAAALLFAIIGNAGRLVSIFVVARLFGQDLAGGPYHIISGYLSFPFAIGAMILFSKLLNIQPARVKSVALQKDPVSYDY